MGNNIATRVRKIFYRNHLEIQSISARIERAQTDGVQEKHEVYVNSVGNVIPTITYSRPNSTDSIITKEVWEMCNKKK